MKLSFFTRYARLVVIAFVCLLPVLLVGVRGAIRGGGNDVRDWLPEGFQETRQYAWFLSQFGSEEMMLVSWPGATLQDGRIERLAEVLGPLVEITPAGSQNEQVHSEPLFRSVVTPLQAIRQLVSEPLNLPVETAMERLRGTLIGPDGKTAGLVISVNQRGAADRHAAVEAVYRAGEAAGIARSELRLGGPTIDSVALDKESERSRYLLSGLSVVISLAVGWSVLRRVRLVAMVFATALLSAAVSVAILHFSGHTLSVVLVMMPTLVYVLAMSGAVHLVNYYQEAVRDRGTAGAAGRALAAAWVPCLLAAGTTSIGLGSLAVSEVVPVKLFGIFSAVAVMASLPILFGFLPALLELWPADNRSSRPASAAPSDRRWLQALACFVARHHVGLAAGSMAVTAVIGAGLLKLETSVKLLNLFSPEATIIRDYTWLEQHLGPLVPVEVVVQFDRDNPLSSVERLELVARIQEAVDSVDKVGGTMSAATFVPPLPEAGGFGATARRAVFNRRLAEAADMPVLAAYLRETSEHQLWRISARVEALNSLDYGYFLEQLRAEIDPLIQRSVAQEGNDIQVVYTGVMPLVYKAQRELLSDLTRSFVSAFVLIAVVMAVLLWGLGAGLVSMVPNAFPAVLLFGGMGWSGLLCDIGAMMTASIAMGIAVDGTIHFLSWFRRGLDRGLSRPEAIRLAYEGCADAMLQTTLIAGLGLLVFAFSGFVPMARFAWFMFALLVSALAGDLLLLPALLHGPLGKFFERRKRPAVVLGFPKMTLPWKRRLQAESVLAAAE